MLGQGDCKELMWETLRISLNRLLLAMKVYIQNWVLLLPILPNLLPVNLEMSFAAVKKNQKKYRIVLVAPGPVTKVLTSPQRITRLRSQFCTTSAASSILLLMNGSREILPSIIGN